MVRKASGVCHYCHYRYQYHPIVSSDPEDIAEAEAKKAVRGAYARLQNSWSSDDLDEQEAAAWNLIDKVEDLLGKE